MDADGENLQAANLTGPFKLGTRRSDPLNKRWNRQSKHILFRSSLSLHTNRR